MENSDVLLNANMCSLLSKIKTLKSALYEEQLDLYNSLIEKNTKGDTLEGFFSNFSVSDNTQAQGEKLVEA